MTDSPTVDPAPAPAHAAAPDPTAVPPPAASAVLDGKTERELALERQLEAAESARKKAETDAAYAQDEARRLKETPAPAPKPKSKPKRAWYDIPTLLDAEED